MENLSALTAAIIAFRDARDWQQFHSPRNLAAALSVEAAELQEALLWKSDEEVRLLLASPEAGRVAAEIADVLIYALLFCKEAGIDPASAIVAKLKENEAKYPVDLAKGRATKYTDLPASRPRQTPAGAKGSAKPR